MKIVERVRNLKRLFMRKESQEINSYPNNANLTFSQIADKIKEDEMVEKINHESLIREVTHKYANWCIQRYVTLAYINLIGVAQNTNINSNGIKLNKLIHSSGDIKNIPKHMCLYEGTLLVTGKIDYSTESYLEEFIISHYKDIYSYELVNEVIKYLDGRIILNSSIEDSYINKCLSSNYLIDNYILTRSDSCIKFSIDINKFLYIPYTPLF